MLLDSWYLAMATLAGGTAASVAFTLYAGTSRDAMTESQLLALERAVFTDPRGQSCRLAGLEIGDARTERIHSTQA